MIVDIDALMNDKFITQDKFALEVETEASRPDTNYFESILLFCERHDLDVTMVPKLLNRQIREKLEVEMTELHYLKQCKFSSLFDED